ncbi:MAG: murE [Gammaproteobacteria bacterium]|jgi:UDP-N-acetylmuramoyl-L-alanyl-D-glutamate--2,6-diaminopimelate ligase|nr:murE [Gammaproteobacteria bacterium]
MVKLSQLCKDFTDISADVDVDIHDLCEDSREAKAGDLFIARRGEISDARKFVGDALRKGAVAVLYEVADGRGLSMQHLEGWDPQVPLLPVSRIDEILGTLAKRFFNDPTRNMAVIGVTGTNGKTSVTQYIAQALRTLQFPCGIIGTLGYGMKELITTSHTTPDVITLNRYCSQFKSEGARAIAMEVSSHALEQKRIAGLHLHMGILTNLTRDHLDYHQTMAAYAKAKRKLFTHPGLKLAIINAQDEFGVDLLKSLPHNLSKLAYAIDKPVKGLGNIAQIYATDIALSNQGLHFKVETPMGQIAVETTLLGHFNVANVLATIGALLSLNFSTTDIERVLPLLQSVNGRMQMLGGGKKPRVVIDYAHTPDALAQVLLAIKAHNPERIICIFGCGGDRDKGKRPFMGKIAETYSDYCIITNDNPRHEKPLRIAEEIVTGMTQKTQRTIILDRKEAISVGIHKAGLNDIVLIAGKGHETYQQIGDIKHPLSDMQIALEVLKDR